MVKYTVREISSRRDIRKFIAFPDRLYRHCPQYVPALHGDQMRSLTKCASLKYCKRKLWVAENADGKIVGRICGMINPRYNEFYSKKRARFGWFDCIDDFEVAKVLLSTAEQWARSEGMTEIHGPLYYNTMGKQGMLVEGFDHTPVFNCLYNYSYYNDFVTAFGYTKECDWLEYRMISDEGVPDKVVRIAGLLKEKYHLHEGNLDRLKKDPAMIRKFFDAYNKAFASAVYNFIPFTDEEIEEESKAFMPYLKDKVSSIILDENDDLVAFGIAVPHISEALKKAKGHLFPFGWYHILKAMNKFDTVDLMLNGAVPSWQNKGVSALFHSALSDKYTAAGAHWAYSNPQIETNSAVNIWASYQHEFHMRRRCYLKEL